MPDAVERFRREARAVAALRHPNIVAVHDVGEAQGIQYFTMEFIEGLPLDRRLLRGPLSAEEAVDIVIPVAEALHYAHGEGVVHRDIKPSNIIVDARGTPFLVDFGIARRKSERTKLEEPEDELLGSIPYMAPEYVDGAAYDERCDVYSLGVVLYEALSGHESLPFYDRSTTRLLERIVAEPPVHVKQRVPALEDDLAAIVMRSIARDREVRYITGGSLAADLRAWRRGDPVTARPRSALQRGVADLRGRAPIFAAVLGMLAIASAGLALLANQDVRALRHELEAERERAAGDARGRDRELCRSLLELGTLREQRGDMPGAVAAYTHAIELFADPTRGVPTVAEAFARRGKIRIASGDPNAAREGEADIAHAARIDPRYEQQPMPTTAPPPR
jgi:serine/threonine-protein kinase